jgi:hypothetical protein
MVVEHQTATGAGADSANQPLQDAGQVSGRNRGQPVPVPQDQPVDSAQKGKQFRFRKPARVVSDQNTACGQIHFDPFDLGRTAQYITHDKSPFPLNMIRLL